MCVCAFVIFSFHGDIHVTNKEDPLCMAIPWNIADMSLTRDTSHFERSALNDVAPKNMRLMSVTLRVR